MSVISWIIDQRNEYIKRGGTIISEEWELARTEICDGCQFNGMVDLDDGLGKTEGCTAPGCNCPFATKRVMHTFYRKKGKEDEQLTASELLEINTLRKLNPKGYVKTIIKCSHPEGNQWEDVDKHFSLLN